MNGTGTRIIGMVRLLLALAVSSEAATVANLSFTNIAEMLASTRTNVTADVDSYYGTNDADGVSIGGGSFKWFPSRSATNLGKVFNARRGGQWRRKLESPSITRVAWFGVLDSWSEAGSTYFDCSNRVHNAIDSSPNNSLIIFPDMTLSCAITISERVGLTLRGEGDRRGARNGFSDGPGIAFSGVTNTPLIKIWNSPYCSIENLALSVNTPINMPTNNASTAIDIDMVQVGGMITTDTKISDVFIYNRVPNTNFTGIYISRTSLANVEKNYLNGVTIYGGGAGVNWAENTTNGGIGIRIGSSDNAYECVFEKLDFQGCSVAIRQDNGGLRVRDVYSYMIPLIYELNGRNTTTEIVFDHSELYGQLARIKSNGGVQFSICALNDSPFITTTNPAIHVWGEKSGVVRLGLLNNKFFAYTWRQILSVTRGEAFRTYLSSELNEIGQSDKYGDNEFDHPISDNDYIAVGGVFWTRKTGGPTTNSGPTSFGGGLTNYGVAPFVSYPPIIADSYQVYRNNAHRMDRLSAQQIGLGNVAIVNSNGVMYRYSVSEIGVLIITRLP